MTMEFLLLQYGFAVLICLWWIRPFGRVSVSKKLTVPLFNLICFLILSFTLGFSLVHAARPANHQSSGFDWLFLGFHFLVTLLVPAGYVYLIMKFYQRPVNKSDRIHLLPGTVFLVALAIPYAVSRNSFLFPEKDPFFTISLFGYCIIGLYILLVIKFMLAKNLPFSVGAKAKKNPAELQLRKKTIRMGTELNEVVVGTVHLDATELARMNDTIRNIMVIKQPYLKRGYNLKQLSEDTSIPLHQLSAFINQYYHIHFNDLINEYRVYYCQNKIKNDEWKAKTLEAIAEESGFNNRNTFTAAFKKVTGANPSEFLRTVKQQKIA